MIGQLILSVIFFPGELLEKKMQTTEVINIDALISPYLQWCQIRVLNATPLPMFTKLTFKWRIVNTDHYELKCYFL